MKELDARIKKEYPVLTSRDIVYLDNGATSQKPQVVIDTVNEFYEKHNANPMRGLYDLSYEATEAYDNARKNVADFIGAKDSDCIVFTRNATESLNLVAYSYAESVLKEGDEVIVSIAEHHSNFLPWQNAAKKCGAEVKFFECEQDGYFDPEKLRGMVSEKTKILAITHVSNIFGRVNDIKSFAEIIHGVGGVIVVDGAQSTPHIPVDVTELDADFFAFSGHKMFSPMGIGVLYGKRELLEKMPPFLYGGEMIEYVFTDRVKFAEIPHKFEAGTVNAGGAVGLNAAIEYIKGYGFPFIEERENALTVSLIEKMKEIPHVNIIGAKDPLEHHGIVTFTIDDVHPHDISAIFSDNKICVRAGHHCAQPLHKHLGLFSTTRASLAFYNNEDDIDAFIDTLKKIRGLMGYE